MNAEAVRVTRKSVSSKKPANENEWDTEIDCLLDSILHGTSETENSSNEDTEDSSVISSRLSITTSRNREEASSITIQRKGLIPSRRNRRKLRKQLLAIHPPAFKPTMRVLKRDIRKKYCEMMNNVINNHDGQLVKQFLQQFCIPEVSVYDPAPNGPASVIKAEPCNIVGIDEIANTWITGFQLMPDFTFQLLDSYIFAAPNQSRSRIVSKVMFHGTKVFNLMQDLPYFATLLTNKKKYDGMSDPMQGFQQIPQVKSILDLVKNQLGQENFQSLVEMFLSASNPFTPASASDNLKKEKQPCKESEPANASTTEGYSMMMLPQLFQLMNFFNDHLSLLAQPISYEIEGVLTTFLDESNRILKFQFDCSRLESNLFGSSL